MLATCGCETAPPPTEPDGVASLRRACAYLWSRQSDDGAWRSSHYAMLREGEALTPFVLAALVRVDPEVSAPPTGAVDRALDFMRDRVSPEGLLGVSDPELLEYPCYATAFALRCFVAAGGDADAELIQRLAGALHRKQFQPANGWGPEQPVHGGWGFGGPLAEGSPGHVDISYTRHVLEALRLSGNADAETCQRARRFLRYLQRHPDDPRRQPARGASPAPNPRTHDGGFYLSPVVLDANKAGQGTLDDGTVFHRSYATATCDGLLALLAAGVDATDPRIVAAAAWLRSQPELARPGGIPVDEPNGWAEAIHFYHLAVRAEAHRAVGAPDGWRARIVALVTDLQDADGGFRNRRGHLMKENDDLIATTLAVTALGAATGRGSARR